MNFTKQFILKNILNIKNRFWEINNEAIDNLIWAFRDELYQLWETDDHPWLEQWSPKREEAFTERAREKFISLTVA